MKPLAPSLPSRAAGPAADPLRIAHFLLLAAALVCGTAASAAPAGSTLAISQAWMRFIIPTRPLAGYFSLANPTAEPRILTGASSPACGVLMLHRSLHQGNEERMVMAKSVAVPAHGVLVFAPGGYHLMCMAPTKEVKIGYRMPVTLTFADGSRLTADFDVRGPSGR